MRKWRPSCLGLNELFISVACVPSAFTNGMTPRNPLEPVYYKGLIATVMIIKGISRAFVHNMSVQLMTWYWIIPDKTKWMNEFICFLLCCALSNMSCKHCWIKQGRGFNQIGFCPAEIILGHIEIFLPFAWLQNIEMAQVVDIVLHWWQRSV